MKHNSTPIAQPALWTRRDMLKWGAAGVGAACLPSRLLRAAEPTKKLRVAAIFTEFTYRSHAHVLLENFVQPYIFRGKLVDPNMEVVSMYGDQFPEQEIGHQVSKQFNIPIVPSIREALTLGGKNLAVDAVLSIGEHGHYPKNDFDQVMYPRKQFFDGIVGVMRETGQVAPIFNDKHLSYRWDWASEMYNTAKEMKIPFMAGSSVPLAERTPPMELPPETEFDDLLLVHGGGFDGYDFHGLEVLQSLTESRKGGETGVESVQYLTGPAVWKAAEEKLWNPELVEPALKPSFKEKAAKWREFTPNPILIIVRYKDGLHAPMLSVPGSEWCFGCRLKGDSAIHATRFHVGPWQNRNLFKALSHAIQHFFRTGVSPYPLERTLLTTGMTEAACHSAKTGEKPFPTPYLDIHYQPRDYRAFRENGESWKILTYAVPEPKGMETLGGISVPK
ncbi:MAG: hypothetical protein U0903_00870 [Planctomycetales bacterium]